MTDPADVCQLCGPTLPADWRETLAGRVRSLNVFGSTDQDVYVICSCGKRWDHPFGTPITTMLTAAAGHEDHDAWEYER